MANESSEVIGTILSGATTTKATCLLRIGAERGTIKEGMLVVVGSQTKEGRRNIIARVESIQPIDESYEQGGFLTEAIRKGMSIPTDVSRKFEIAELDLLFALSKGREEIRYPPLAGDNVSLIKDVKKLAPEIFGVKEEDMIIEYGTLVGYEDLPVMLDVQALPMHLAVFGITGSGKSFNVGALIEQLSNIRWKKARKHFPILAIDPNGDYVDYWEHFIVNGKLGAYPQVIRYVFSLKGVTQTLPKKCTNDPNIYLRLFNIDLNEFKASPRDLAEAIIVYYAGDVAGRELQASNLGALLHHMIYKGMVADLNALFSNQKLFENLKNLLGNPPEGISIHEQTARAIERQLDTFKRDIIDNYQLISKAHPFTGSTVDELVKKGGLAVIDFTVNGAPGYPLYLKQFTVYYIAYVLFKRFVAYKQQEDLQRSLLFVIEEAQNYCPNLAEYRIGYSLARDVLQQIATQGRKFGLCLCLLTQRPSFVDPVIISMCNTFIIHRIAPGDESFVRRVTGGLPSSLERKLTKLETGYAIITGQAVKSGLPVLAHIRPDIDRIVEQKAGTVEIAPGLPEATSEEG
ncbi:MAG: ATP-binding protein [Candidatus Caldarchaeum sp.]